LLRAARETLRWTTLRLVLLSSAGGVALACVMFLLQPYLRSVGFSVSAGGALCAILLIVGALGASVSRRLALGDGANLRRFIFAGSSLLTVLALLLVATKRGVFIVLGLALAWLVVHFVHSRQSVAIQRTLSDETRATSLSLVNLLSSLLISVAAPLLGSMADAEGFRAAIVALCLGSLGLCALVPVVDCIVARRVGEMERG
jgi:hypothetical protein